MTKVRIYLLLTLAIEGFIFYFTSLKSMVAIPIMLLTFIAMAFFLVPNAEKRDLDRKLDSYKDQLPEILGTLRTFENTLNTKSFGHRIKELGTHFGFKNLDSLAEQEINDLHQKVVTRFREIARTRGEQLDDETLNFITLNILNAASSIGKEFVEAHLDYETKKYKDEGLRETYRYSLNINSGQISHCAARETVDSQEHVSESDSAHQVLAAAQEDIDLCIQGILDAEEQITQGAGKMAAWSLDDSCRYLLAFAFKMKFKAAHEEYMERRISELEVPENYSRMDIAKLMKNIVSDVGVNGDVWYFSQSCIDGVLTEESLDAFERLRNILPIWRNEIDRVFRIYRSSSNAFV